MRQVFVSVQVITEGHPRKGQAGHVIIVDPKKPDEVGVKFDVDGVIEAVAMSDLRQL
jgi:hypothetical protein